MVVLQNVDGCSYFCAVSFSLRKDKALVIPCLLRSHSAQECIVATAYLDSTRNPKIALEASRLTLICQVFYKDQNVNDASLQITSIMSTTISDRVYVNRGKILEADAHYL